MPLPRTKPALLVGLAFALVATAGADRAEATFPAPAQRILISTEAFLTGPHLSLLTPQGRLLRIPGTPVGVRSEASMSPDGTQIAFTITTPLPPPLAGGNDSEIGLALVAGAFRFLTTDEANQGRPSWSPDAARLAFASDRAGSWDVYVGAAANPMATPANLTAASPAADLNPRWSPDGRRIAFDTNRDGNWEIYVMNANGSNPVNVTRSPAAERLGDWSPDSTRLVFSSDRAGNHDLYVTGAEGGEAARITTSPGTDSNAAWSPDGRTIAFSSDRDGDRDVFVVGSDGTRERQMTRNAAEDVVLDWQPLQDTQPPVAAALAGTGVRGRALRLRYRVVDDSGRAAVRFSLDLGTASVGFLSFGRGGTPLSPARAGRTYSVTLPAELVRGLPGQFRFCVAATDPSGNGGRERCAGVRLRGAAPSRP